MKNKAQWGWSFYDFANSAFATSVLTFIFPFFFKDVMVGKDTVVSLLGFEWQGKSLYPLIVSLSLLIVLISSPIMGRLADKLQYRKKFLLTYCWVGSACTSALFFLDEGQWQWAALLFGVANIGFAGGNVFYNALLKEVSTEENLAKWSGRGWALGYAGGFTALIIQLVFIMYPGLAGITKLEATRWSLLTTGLWWALWSLPLAIWVKEEGKGDSESLSVSDLKTVFREVTGNRYLLLFLASFFLFNDAVETTISQAANLAEELLSMELQEVLIAGVAIQFVAIFGSLLFLRVEKKWGTRKALLAALANWCLIMIWAMVMQSKSEFYALCIWVGLVMGVTQSASRTLFGNSIPREKSSTFFAFYTLSQKASAMLGPFLFALAAKFFPIRMAVLPLVVMLLFGTYLLVKLPKNTKEVFNG